MSDKWIFDDYGYENPKLESSVEVTDTKEGQKLVVSIKGEKVMEVSADLDQWGTWITFSIQEKFTVAQEGETRSFIDALIKGLTAIKPLCDCGPPIESTYVKTEDAIPT